MGTVGRPVASISALVLALLLLAGSASAYTIDKVWIDWQGNEVKTISPNATLPDATLKVRLSPDFKDCFERYRNNGCEILLAYSFTSTGLAKPTINIRSCAPDNNSLICSGPAFTLATKNATNTVGYAIAHPNITGAGREGTATITLQLDNTTPRVDSIRTGYCVGDLCYASAVAPTPITITFNDTVTAFNFKLVALGREGANSLWEVGSCQGRTCTGTIRLSCTDGEQVLLQLRSALASKEDAQNIVIPGEPLRVVCSNKAPTVEWGTMTADGIAGQAVSGGSLTLKATVRSLGRPNATVNTTNVTLQNLTAAVCTSETADADVYTCTWTLSPLQYNPAVSGRAILNFRVTNALGAGANKTFAVTILNLTAPRAGNNTLDFFTIQPTKVTPERINRMALDLARGNYLPYPAYLEYNIVRKNTRARIIKQELKTCWYKLPNETNYTSAYNLFSFGGRPVESRVLYPEQDYSKPNRLNLQIRADRTLLAKADTFDVRCQMDLFVAEGDTFYNRPQSTNFTFKIQLRDAAIGQPGAAFVEKIKATEAKVGQPSTAEKIDRVMGTLGKVCDAAEMLYTVHTLGSSMQAAGNAMCYGPLAPAGEKLNYAGGKIAGPTGKAVDYVWEQPRIPGVPIKEQLQKALAGSQPGARNTIGTTVTNELVPQNSLILLGGGPLKMMCRQVNCRALPDIKAASMNYQNPALDGQTKEFRDFQVQAKAYREGASGTPPKATAGVYKGYVLSQIDSGASVADPKTLTGALSMQCMGGVVYSLRQKDAIDCQYLQCLKEQSASGLSVQTCEMARSYQQCLSVAGEAYEAPLARTTKNMMGNLNHMLQNSPTLAANMAFDIACAKHTVREGSGCTDVPQIFCRVRKSFLGMADVKKQSVQAMSGISAQDRQQLNAMCAGARASVPGRSRSYSDPQLEQLGRQAAGEYGKYADYGKQFYNFAAFDRELRILRQTGQTYTEKVPDLNELAKKNLDNLGSSMPAYYKVVGDKIEAYSPEAKLGEFKATPEMKRLVENPVYQRIITNQDVNKILASGDNRHIRIDANGNVQLYDLDNRLVDNIIDPVTKQINPRELDKYVHSTVNKVADAVKNREVITTMSADPKLRKDIEVAYKALADPKFDPRGNARVSRCNNGNDVCVSVPCPKGSTCPDLVLTKADLNLQRQQAAYAAEQRAEAVGMFTDYVAKKLFDAGYLNFLTLKGMTGINVRALDPEQWTLNLCNAASVDIQENDEGGIFQVTTTAVKPIATFGSEVMLVENETNKTYAYVTAVLVTNPERNHTLFERVNYNYTMEIIFSEPQSCLNGTCPDRISLTNGAYYNLTEGRAFGNGQAPMTRIVYLPGRYGKVCILFDHKFPDDNGRTSFCRTISEQTFERGSPAPGITIATPSATPGSTLSSSNPLEGWS